MFQDHALFPHRDVLDNVAFGPRMQGAGRAAAVEQARRMLGLVGLAGFEHRRIAELSGGEQQRVALARSLAPSPRLLMLDEPLGALDRHLRERLVDDLGRLFRSLGQSVLLVTHDHDEAFGLADRVAILDHGRIEQVGPPTALWRRPETEFVAEFLGWNVLVDGARRVAIRPDALHLLAPGETSGQAAADREATPATPFGVGGPFTGIVRSRMFRRDHWRVRVALDADGSPVGERSRDEQRGNEQRGNEPLVHEQAVEVVVRDREPPAPGDRVRLTVDAHGMVELP
jgi:thiamine transport system ATP-binding protein